MRRRRPLQPTPKGLVRPALSEIDQLRGSLHTALDAVPSRAQLAKEGLIANAVDRERLRQRRMLKVALEFVRDNLLPYPYPDVGEDGSLALDTSDERKIETFSEVHKAIRHFTADLERLDRGLKAETVLSPVDVEGDDKGDDLVGPQRDILLWTLLYLNFRPRERKSGVHFECASYLSGYGVATLKTQQKNLRASIKNYAKDPGAKRQIFSKAECQAFLTKEKAVLGIVGGEGRGRVADLIAPAIAGLAKDLEPVKPIRGAKR
jgi:hypothetical protein